MRKLGTLSRRVEDAIRAAPGLERLELAIERVSAVENWDELLPL